jgi:cob(I)alamin adenosyltransferase
MKKSVIYTKTGDNGTTALVGGLRVRKTHIRLEAYGTIDELNSHIGWLNCEIKEKEHHDFLLFIQHKLFAVGSFLATETESKQPMAASIITTHDIERIEKQIDQIDEALPRLNRFVLPGGNEAASRAHICRTVTRRAERIVNHLAENFPVSDEILIFLNRLSDYFFVLARRESRKTSEEIFWQQDDV